MSTPRTFIVGLRLYQEPDGQIIAVSETLDDTGNVTVSESPLPAHMAQQLPMVLAMMNEQMGHG